MDLDTLLEQLATHPVSDVVKAIQSKAQPVFQDIFNKGHGAKAKSHETELTTANARIRELEGSVQEKDEQIESLSKRKPEHAADLDNYRKQAADAKKELEDYKKSVATQRRDDLVKSARDRLATKLAEKGVVKDIADARALLNGSRLKAADDDRLVLLQPNSDLELSLATGVDPVDFLADEIVKTVPTDYIRSNVGAGSGLGTAPRGTNTNDPVAAILAANEARTKGASPLDPKGAKTATAAAL